MNALLLKMCLWRLNLETEVWLFVLSEVHFNPQYNNGPKITIKCNNNQNQKFSNKPHANVKALLCVPTTNMEFVVHVSLLARALFISSLLLALWNQVANRPSRLTIWPDRIRKSSMSPFVGKHRGVPIEPEWIKKKQKTLNPRWTGKIRQTSVDFN